MYWWAILISFFMFASPATYGIATQWFKHKENMQGRRNEELRLQIQLEQARQEYFGARRSPLVSDLQPKEVSWNDQIQTTYEMGYQQINQTQI